MPVCKSLDFIQERGILLTWCNSIVMLQPYVFQSRIQTEMFIRRMETIRQFPLLEIGISKMKTRLERLQTPFMTRSSTLRKSDMIFLSSHDTKSRHNIASLYMPLNIRCILEIRCPGSHFSGYLCIIFSMICKQDTS